MQSVEIMFDSKDEASRIAERIRKSGTNLTISFSTPGAMDMQGTLKEGKTAFDELRNLLIMGDLDEINEKLCDSLGNDWHKRITYANPDLKQDV